MASFKLQYRAQDGKSTTTYKTLEALTVAVKAQWQGADYIDGPAGFHTDYARYEIVGATLADLGVRKFDPKYQCFEFLFWGASSSIAEHQLQVWDKACSDAQHAANEANKAAAAANDAAFVSIAQGLLASGETVTVYSKDDFDWIGTVTKVNDDSKRPHFAAPNLYFSLALAEGTPGSDSAYSFDHTVSPDYADRLVVNGTTVWEKYAAATPLPVYPALPQAALDEVVSDLLHTGAVAPKRGYGVRVWEIVTEHGTYTVDIAAKTVTTYGGVNRVNRLVYLRAVEVCLQSGDDGEDDSINRAYAQAEIDQSARYPYND